jgi:hypothetical protein
MKRKSLFIVVSAAILGILGIVKMMSLKDVVQFDDVLKEYPYLLLKEKVDSEVADIYCPPGTRCGGGIITSIKMNDGLKRTIVARKDVNDSLRLDDVMFVGSKILKESGNDTLLVYSNKSPSVIYKFVIREKYP